MLFRADRTIELEAEPDGQPYCFFDLLAFTDIDPQNPQGNIVQTLNGAHPAYLQPLADGDVAYIHWEKLHPETL